MDILPRPSGGYVNSCLISVTDLKKMELFFFQNKDLPNPYASLFLVFIIKYYFICVTWLFLFSTHLFCYKNIHNLELFASICQCRNVIFITANCSRYRGYSKCSSHCEFSAKLQI